MMVAALRLPAEESFSIMATNLAMDGQPNWFQWYNPSDSPEGAYLGVILETATSLTGTIPLGRTLAPGRYYVAVKVFAYGANKSLALRMGGGSGQVTNPSTSSFSGQWTEMVAIDVVDPASSLEIEVYRTLPLGSRQLYLLRGLYITSVSDRIISGGDSIFNVHYPTQTNSNPVVKGNLIENGSFEVGLRHGWGLEEQSERPYPLQSLWDETVAFDGNASLRLPPGDSLVSRIYRFKPNTFYTLTARVRTPQPATIKISIETPYVLPSPYPPTENLEVTYQLPSGSAWRLVQLDGVVLRYPTSEYRIRFERLDFGTNDAWLDAIQVEEGTRSAYEAPRPVEIGLASASVAGIFFEDEPVVMQLLARNHGAEEQSSAVLYEVYDYVNKKVLEGSTNITIDPLTSWAGELDLSLGRRGFFRVKAWLAGAESAAEEACYSIMPRPRQMGVDESSIIGIHAEFTDFQMEALQRLGIKWNCTASPSKAFRWSEIEPMQGVYQWSSEPVGRSADYGMSVLGTIGQEWPAWADVAGQPNLDAWETFVETVVDRYKDDVKFWEIWNEPQLQFSASFYADVLERAVAAARRADPQAQIVALGGSASVSWSSNVLSLIDSNTRAQITAGSTHLYPNFPLHNYTSFRDQIVNGFNLPLWNSESGVWDRGSYLGRNSSFLQADDYAWLHKDSERYHFSYKGAPQLLCQNFLNSIGLGLSKYFYYDARIAVGPGSDGTHSTIFHYDDSIALKGVAYGILAWVFDHSVGLGNISPNLHTTLYLFNRGGTPLAAIWSADQAPRSITVSLAPNQFVVYDMMGNPVSISGSTIPYDGTPVYVEGIGVSVQDFQAAFEAGQQMSRPDTQAPNLSVEEFSGDVTTDLPLRFRWLAIDDTAVPSSLSPSAIEYSHRLAGYEAAWSEWSARAFVDYLGVPSGNYTFEVVARDAAGNLSNTSRVSVAVSDGLPAILTQPQDVAAPAGSDAIFTVEAAGPAPLAYQWRKDGVGLTNSARIFGVNSATLFVTDLETGDEGGYSVVVSNPFGSITSETATLSLTAATQFYFSNPRVSGGKFQVEIVGAPSEGSIIIEKSNDLEQWMHHRTVNLPAGTLEWDADSAYQYYRGRIQ